MNIYQIVVLYFQNRLGVRSIEKKLVSKDSIGSKPSESTFSRENSGLQSSGIKEKLKAKSKGKHII